MNAEIRPGNHAGTREILTVSELNRVVAGILERSLAMVRVEGELSNVVRAASGHWYFSLKDPGAQVRCVMFRGKARHVDFVPREGDRVEVLAFATLYEARGEFQLNVEAMRRAGAGDLYRRFLELKERLQKEGLFDATRKRALPAAPAAIGVVTSPQAAALRDVLTTLRRRAPAIPVVVYPTQVQGADAPAQIVAAIGRAAARRDCDVLLVVRGGGSIEDLWSFNDERVARAIAACPLPVVVGVGHETDFTIADFVADLRAPTPTAAAELVAPDRRELARGAHRLAQRLRAAMLRALDRAGQRLDTGTRLLRPPSAQWRDRARRVAALAQRLAAAGNAQRLRRSAALERLAARLRAPRADLARQRLAALERRLAAAGREALAWRARRVDSAAAALALVSPQAVLDRGYAIVTGEDGTVLRDAALARTGEQVSVRLAHGSIDAAVTAVRPEQG
ncbi:exodeoxyribonuclease VII large subunit [Burkholderiaceae bacterium FT117]|uniref:exodeoxyribonuclease VII large subunit n=1 Tax=Zeimonas sediminis TaxID=2944268 RepID=UPI002342DC36|nr:exodeoxyribonuclease VII large subunit [Zeimonas sediminis]MCM5572276.1 exodeoxyribonuclease VII large subunit [Zeimonas sediminis]